MEPDKSIEILGQIEVSVLTLSYQDSTGLDAIRRKMELYIKKIFGTNSDYIEAMKRIQFHPTVAYGGMSVETRQREWQNGKKKMKNLIHTMIEDVNLSVIEETQIANKSEQTTEIINSNIFLVHGHNEEMKSAVARAIEKMKLIPIILHEQANRGLTIIEKFSEHSNVGFAIVLLSPDDFAYDVTLDPKEGKLRARQNVIFEFGYFIGKIGRQKVVAIYQEVDNFEFPSDYQGVIFIPYDKNGNWKFQIVKELKECGYNVDANLVL